MIRGVSCNHYSSRICGKLEFLHDKTKSPQKGKKELSKYLKILSLTISFPSLFFIFFWENSFDHLLGSAMEKIDPLRVLRFFLSCRSLQTWSQETTILILNLSSGWELLNHLKSFFLPCHQLLTGSGTTPIWFMKHLNT